MSAVRIPVNVRVLRRLAREVATYDRTRDELLSPTTPPELGVVLTRKIAQMRLEIAGSACSVIDLVRADPEIAKLLDAEDPDEVAVAPSCAPTIPPPVTLGAVAMLCLALLGCGGGDVGPEGDAGAHCRFVPTGSGATGDYNIVCDDAGADGGDAAAHLDAVAEQLERDGREDDAARLRAMRRRPARELRAAFDELLHLEPASARVRSVARAATRAIEPALRRERDRRAT